MRKRKFVAILVFLAICLASLPLYHAGSYQHNRNRFFASLLEGDLRLARDYLMELRSYHNDLKDIPLGEWLSDNLFFKDAWFYEAVYLKERGEYEQLVENLQGKQDYRAQHLVGCALFKAAKKQYSRAENAEEKQETIRLVLEEVKLYFKRSLEMMDESTDYGVKFRDVWNYDLTSDEGAAKSALEQGEEKVKLKLGFEFDGGAGEQRNDQNELNIKRPKPGGDTRKKKG